MLCGGCNRVYQKCIRTPKRRQLPSFSICLIEIRFICAVIVFAWMRSVSLAEKVEAASPVNEMSSFPGEINRTHILAQTILPEIYCFMPGAACHLHIRCGSRRFREYCLQLKSNTFRIYCLMRRLTSHREQGTWKHFFVVQTKPSFFFCKDLAPYKT